MIVPTSSGRAPYLSWEGTHSSVKTNFSTPYFENTGSDSVMSRRKKYAIRTRIAAASPVSTHRSRRSGSRDSGVRARTPPVTVPVAISGAADGLPVAAQAVDLGLRLLVQLVRQLGVLQLAGDVLPVALGVVQPRLQPLGGLRVLARLADVLVDEQEGQRGDRIGLRARRVDGRDPQVVGDRQALAGGRRRVERRRDEV